MLKDTDVTDLAGWERTGTQEVRHYIVYISNLYMSQTIYDTSIYSSLKSEVCRDCTCVTCLYEVNYVFYDWTMEHYFIGNPSVVQHVRMYSR